MFKHTKAMLKMVCKADSAGRSLIGVHRGHPKTWPGPPNGTRRPTVTSPDGSPSFRLPIYHQAAGDLAVHKGRLRDGQSLKQPGDWTLQTLGTFFCAARVSPGTRDMPLAIHSAGNIALDVGCSPSQTLASAPG
ncbi:hypothetical protein Trisim1_001262 [Trichoderma cf. simile WF8]